MARRLAGLVVALGLSCVVASAPSAAQGQRGEAELLAGISQSPQVVSNYLDLAKLLIEQGRLEEAEQMLTRATAVVRQQRLGGVVISSPTQTLAPIRVGGDIKEPMKIRDVKPIYPPDALAADVQGVVIMEAIIGPTGDVTDVKVLRSIAMLDQAAVDAVRQWRFTPTLLNGVPASVIMTVTVNFTK